MRRSQLQAGATGLSIHVRGLQGGLVTGGRANKPAAQVSIVPIAVLGTTLEISHAGPQLKLLAVQVQLASSWLIIDAKPLARNHLGLLLVPDNHILSGNGIFVSLAVKVLLQKAFH